MMSGARPRQHEVPHEVAYTDPQVLDTFGAVERLPELRPENQAQAQRKNGTYDDGSVVVGVVPSVVVNMREGLGNAANGDRAAEAENAVLACDAMTCACVLNTSIEWKKTGPGRGNRGHWRAIASSGSHGPGRGEPGPQGRGIASPCD